MTTILLPPHVPPVDPLEAGPEASTVTDALRAAATAASDVSTWSSAHGAPWGWEGDASDAASHAMTRLARDADVVTIALEEAVRACDVYVEQVSALAGEREGLVLERGSVNDALDDLAGRIESSTADSVPALRAEAESLSRRVASLRDRISTWHQRVAAAEDRVIAALRSVDTVAEAGTVARASGRADPATLVRDLQRVGDHPADVARWWSSLADTEREALTIHSPELVGNLNGIPVSARDDANRATLLADLEFYEGLEARGQPLAEDQQRAFDRARETSRALDVPGGAIDPHTGLPVAVNLVVYLPAAFGGDGAAAVAYGDPDTADNTAIVVPGLTNDMTRIASQGEDAYRLFWEASHRDADDDGVHDESSATIAWMGYDAPSGELTSIEGLLDLGAVTREDKAEAGGHLLADFVDGLRATDRGEQSHLTVIGHSYGSTTAAHAAADGLAEDALVLVGSPGAGGGVDHASGLDAPPGRVYVGSGDHDPVTWLGRDGRAGMGEDPAQADFGAVRFHVDSPVFGLDDPDQALDNHTSYFDSGSDSLASISAIVNGDPPHVEAGRTTDANRMAADWATDATVQWGRDWVGDRVDSFRDLWR